MKRFLSLFLLAITALYFYKFGGKDFFTTKITWKFILTNADVLLPALMSLIAAHGLWHNSKWGKDVSQFTLGLISYASFKFLITHLTFTAGIATFVFPLAIILFLLLIFV